MQLICTSWLLFTEKHTQILTRWGLCGTKMRMFTCCCAQLYLFFFLTYSYWKEHGKPSLQSVQQNADSSFCVLCYNFWRTNSTQALYVVVNTHALPVATRPIDTFQWSCSDRLHLNIRLGLCYFYTSTLCSLKSLCHSPPCLWNSHQNSDCISQSGQQIQVVITGSNV